MRAVGRLVKLGIVDPKPGSIDCDTNLKVPHCMECIKIVCRFSTNVADIFTPHIT
jgi:hypothetical protein